MPAKVRITVGTLALDVLCRDTPTARAVLDACPIEATAKTWGEEVYFSTPLDVERESDEKIVIEPGEIAFWVDGRAIAIGYGPTPASQGDEIRLAAPTNIWADAESDIRALTSVSDGDPVRVEAL